MKNIIRVFKMDLSSIKAYLTLKNIILYIAIMLSLGIFMKTTNFTMPYVLILIGMYMNYPFIMGDNFGMEYVYRLLGIKNNNIVIGRYLYTFIIFIMLSMMGNITKIIIYYVNNTNISIENSLFTTLSIFLVYIIILVIQMPIFFKLDAKKARTYSSITTMVLIFSFVDLTTFTKKTNPILLERITDFFKYNIVISTLIILIIILIILSISIKISIHNFSKKDL